MKGELSARVSKNGGGGPRTRVRAHAPTPWQPSARMLAAIVLVPIAVLLVHEARYVLAFGDESGTELAVRGHAYVAQLIAPLGIVLALALGAYLVRLSRSWRSGQGEDPGGAAPGLMRLWLAATLGLLAIYTGQELLEALLAQGRMPSLAIPFGDGGLWSIPAALLIALAVAALLNGAVQVVELVAALGRRRRRQLAAGRLPIGRPRRARLRLANPLARAGAGRAPPLRIAFPV